MTQPAARTPPQNLESTLIARLRAGDEAAFVDLVERLHPSMVRLARTFVPSTAVAEEVAQEAWLGVLNGIDRFEGRSSLKTWIMQIVTNQAMRRGTRERRSIPFSSLASRDADGHEPAVDVDAFLPADHPFSGHWAAAPRPFPEPEQQLLDKETMTAVKDAIDLLPEAQRAVISLRDVEGWPAEEVCATLCISEGNQRVLLHRARSKVRAALDVHFHGGAA